MTIKKFKRVLIANRGEIAVRIARTLKEMDITPVAVFSEPDRRSAHVLAVDEAHFIGPAAASESYLNVEKLLQICSEHRIDAVHPGYGFLSENAEFARALSAAGVTLIGPPPEAMLSMGSKTQAREKMIKAGVPVVPGSEGALRDPAAALECANKLGFPVMLKASAGGGGKGMRLVHSAGDLESAFRSAASEARSAFGDDEVFLEKAIVGPRHIEIQILSGPDGRTVSLGERECSMQRRHQKVIEESPSVLVDQKLREAMGEQACRAAEAVDYRGAGTVEFLVDRDKNYYFLEMNTRLQVEHPVTELCTGTDLVEMQVRIAQGEPLPWTERHIPARGHAIEARLYAESPRQGFLPSPGLVEQFRLPHGPGIRVDAGVVSNTEVSRHYDPMIAKIVAWGSDREKARKRLVRALSQTVVRGIETNNQFLRNLLRHPSFVSGEYTTHSIEEFQEDLMGPLGEHAPIHYALAALTQFADDEAAAAALPQAEGAQRSSWRRLDWRGA